VGGGLGVGRAVLLAETRVTEAGGNPLAQTPGFAFAFEWNPSGSDGFAKCFRGSEV